MRAVLREFVAEIQMAAMLAAPLLVIFELPEWCVVAFLIVQFLLLVASATVLWADDRKAERGT